MIKKTNFFIKLILLTLFANALPVELCHGKKRNLYVDIAHHYLPVFNIKPKGIDLQTDDSEQQEKLDEKPDLTVRPLSPGEQRRIALSILSNHGDKNYRFNTKLFDEDFWKDLELFCGPIKRRDAHLAQAWNQTLTTLGDVVSKRILVRTTTDIELLKKRQEAIKTLRTKKKLASKLTKALTHFAKQEPVIYSFWRAENPATKKVITDLYFGEKLETLNTNAYALESLTRLRNFQTYTMVSLPFILGIGTHAIRDYVHSENTTLLQAIGRAPGLAWNNLREQYDDLWRMSSGQRKAVIAASAIYVSLYGLVAYRAISAEKQRIGLEKYLQTKLIAISSAIREIFKVYNAVVKNKTLRAAIPSLKHVDQLAHKSQELSEFLKLITTNTFAGQASFFSLTGRVLAANKLMAEIKNHLVKSFEAIGEVDAYLAMAKVLDKFENKQARFSFVDFVENANRPHFDVEGFWLPQLLHDKNIKKEKQSIVVNSIKMGADLRNMILTGPNTAGKSTIIKALICCLLLAQSYGVAPVQRMNFTPFSKIQTYINIPDNAAEGVSLFKAELLRVAHLLNNIQSLKHTEFSFTILDEIFSGTSPEEAIVGSGNVMEDMTRMRNSMNIIATHYGLLTRVEEYTGGIFKNYKVTVDQHSNGDLTFPYTIQRGRSDQHIALALIKKEGFLTEGGKFNLAQRLADDIEQEGIR